MARPTFAPNAAQRATIKALERLAVRMAADDEALTELIGRAKDQGVPIEHIARAGDVTPKTVYRRLGHPMK